MMANVPEPRARAPSRNPGKSKRASTGSELSGSTMAALTKASAPNMTLNQKMARHDQP